MKLCNSDNHYTTTPQASSIIVLLLDAIETGYIREEEMFVASPKGLFLLLLFAELHPVFTGKYLHCVEKDDILYVKSTGLLTILLLC